MPADDDQTELEALEARLAQLADQCRERDHLRSKAAVAEAQLADARSIAADRRLDVALEADDVRALTSFSLTRILAGLHGTRDADLDRETAEHDAARYRLTHAEQRVAGAERLVAGLAEHLHALATLEDEWARAVTDKEAMLVSIGDDRAPRLTEIAERQGALTAEARECHEAIGAGHEAHRQLAAARRELGSADSWSAYDTWFGGGMFVSMMKHDRLDTAAAVLQRAGAALRTFETEVADLGRSAEIRITLDGWDRAVDVWFDNIFTDLSIRRRIKDALADVDEALAAVDRIGREIEHHALAIHDEADRLREERSQLLAR